MSVGYGKGGGPSESNSSSGEGSAPQDWVCLKCHNLNFSFRKRCNRCKVQSREDNQQQYADYYYYNHYYSHYSPQPQSQAAPSSPTAPLSPRAPSRSRRNKENDALPSVSPLLKRTQLKRPPAGRPKGVWNVFGEEVWESEENTLWAGEGTSTDDEENMELLRSV